MSLAQQLLCSETIVLDVGATERPRNVMYSHCFLDKDAEQTVTANFNYALLLDNTSQSCKIRCIPNYTNSQRVGITSLRSVLFHLQTKQPT